MAGGGGGRSAASTSGKRGKFSSPIPIKKARIEIVPLIDVMFFLLAAFMMVTLTMNRLRTLQMDLPSAVAPKSSEKPDMMEITVSPTATMIMSDRYRWPSSISPMLGCS